jgi:hypothetical protein
MPGLFSVDELAGGYARTEAAGGASDLEQLAGR